MWICVLTLPFVCDIMYFVGVDFKMFANERMDYICRMLKKNGAVTTAQLSCELKVSVETVRRDLLALEKAKSLVRVHGGAVLSGGSVNLIPLSERIEQNRDKKRMLSDRACSFIEEGEVIAIDCGSTAIEFASAISEKFSELTVVTHSCDVFEFLRDNSSFQLILAGGNFSREDKAFFGCIAEDIISSLHFNKAFVMPAALSLKNGISDCAERSVRIQQLMIERADMVYALADSDKFEKNALYSVAPLEAAAALITDCGISKELIRLYEENNICVIEGKEEK